MKENLSGTLAIDLGNTNTVIAFQDQKEINPVLIEIPNITSSPGVIPTAIWFEENSSIVKIGISALHMRNSSNSDLYFHSNFKRLIGNPVEKFNPKNILSPNECGEKFFKFLWANIPQKYEIKRLVLTAPIDTYRGYRAWLINLCSQMSVDEIALVDEPTAASLGIKVPFGSKIMTLDIGGSTIDMNIVKIEGGEGKSGPIAELLKFKGNDVSSISKQKLRCAEIISKTGSKIGGKDIDQWIVDYFIPNNQYAINLLKAEEIKCKLSSSSIKYENKYPTKLFIEGYQEKEFYLSQEIFEKIMIKNNFLNHLNSLFKDLLNEARGKFCTVDDLSSIILVGGGTQIPLVQEWIREKIPKVEIKSPPPIEAIALGALSMTPGVKIKDILAKGLSIRLFNKRAQKHFWHPIFCKGQTWPTENPFKLILQASKSNQKIFEIIIGETKTEREYDVIFEDGLPKLAQVQSEEEIVKWDNIPLIIELKNNSNLGEDNLKLFFKITKKADLLVECFDIKDEFLGEYNLGNIF
ncbi:putative DnaK-type molecular chaperone (HSP70 family) [Prochlorococcus marinus str. MIT 9321]|uniref:Putative DnaK-type molecular chaperone (HSP70 family) n=1 Tax=Prochlorococcus marinus str. MIT 9401 TaxID=167551 RepID=A0A0A2B8W0_PROMR|nr:Hsp70 family protein [Prochlorococcus marinus]KGG02634.1 putative DnaK-type molecular chaperone (HSP70 family) [Prochlorococcus marinus str. MIT 9321]KGG05269.1 putative DnaK-type molecular chaperone (HSP70 family) [Prochlorococcus marinus str. MIT 9322]KGG10331.1 putative DnaK-type molecular chaperone (HSP70 family) [Prochlorococcus marinus str. MIT 9401]